MVNLAEPPDDIEDFQLLLLYNGFRRAEDIFQHEHAQNRVQTWLYRAAGWFIALLGFTCLVSILDAIIDDHPLVRGPLSLGFANMQVSFALTTTLLATALGWMIFRPVLGAILIALAVAPLMVTVYKNHRRWKLYPLFKRERERGTYFPSRYCKTPN